MKESQFNGYSPGSGAPPLPNEPPQNLPQRYVQQQQRSQSQQGQYQQQQQQKQPTPKQAFNAPTLNSSNNVNSSYSFSKVNNISQSNLQKLNKYQNSRENLVNTINLKYYL